MDYLNTVTLQGLVMSEPRFGKTQAGKAAVNFKIKTERNVNGRVYTECHNIVAYDRIADLMEASDIECGDCVHIVGRLQTNSRTSCDNNIITNVEVVAYQFAVKEVN